MNIQIAGKRRTRRSGSKRRKRVSKRRSRVSKRRSRVSKRRSRVSKRRSKCNRKSGRKSCKGRKRCSWVKRKSSGKRRHKAYCKRMSGGSSDRGICGGSSDDGIKITRVTIDVGRHKDFDTKYFGESISLEELKLKLTFDSNYNTLTGTSHLSKLFEQNNTELFINAARELKLIYCGTFNCVFILKNDLSLIYDLGQVYRGKIALR